METANSVKTQVRLHYVDYARGFAIILLLLSHAIPSNNDLVKIWISSFDMPIFFIICGILCYIKYPDGVKKENAFSFLKKRIFQLGVPYLFFCLLLTIFYFSLSLVSHSEFNLLMYIIRIFTLKGIDSLWFLPCYFLAEIIFCFVVVKLPKYIRFGIMVLSVIALSLATLFPFPLSTNLLVKVILGIGFVYVGFLISKFQLIKRLPIYISIIIMIICAFLSYANGFIGVSDFMLNNVFLFYFNSIFTSIAVLNIFYYCEMKLKYKFKFLDYFGRNSIVILCTNNLLIEVIRLLDYFVTGNILISWGILGNFIFFIILVLMEVPIIMLSNGHLSFLFGKLRRQ